MLFSVSLSCILLRLHKSAMRLPSRHAFVRKYKRQNSEMRALRDYAKRKRKVITTSTMDTSSSNSRPHPNKVQITQPREGRVPLSCLCPGTREIIKCPGEFSQLKFRIDRRITRRDLTQRWPVPDLQIVGSKLKHVKAWLGPNANVDPPRRNLFFLPLEVMFFSPNNHQKYTSKWIERH